MAGRGDATTTMRLFGLGGFTLNFILESGTFNNFLHEEANQLVLKTLQCAVKHLPCPQYLALCDRAKKYVTGPAYDQFLQWNWTNPWTKDTFAWIFWQSEHKLDILAHSCPGKYTFPK